MGKKPSSECRANFLKSPKDLKDSKDLKDLKRFVQIGVPTSPTRRADFTNSTCRLFNIA